MKSSILRNNVILLEKKGGVNSALFYMCNANLWMKTEYKIKNCMTILPILQWALHSPSSSCNDESFEHMQVLHTQKESLVRSHVSPGKVQNVSQHWYWNAIFDMLIKLIYWYNSTILDEKNNTRSRTQKSSSHPQSKRM